MHIRCDHCGDEILKEEAIAYEADEQVYYFCSATCAEKKGYSPDREAQPDEQPEPAAQP